MVLCRLVDVLKPEEFQLSCSLGHVFPHFVVLFARHLRPSDSLLESHDVAALSCQTAEFAGTVLVRARVLVRSLAHDFTVVPAHVAFLQFGATGSLCSPTGVSMFA